MLLVFQPGKALKIRKIHPAMSYVCPRRVTCVSHHKRYQNLMYTSCGVSPVHVPYLSCVPKVSDTRPQIVRRAYSDL